MYIYLNLLLIWAKMIEENSVLDIKTIIYDLYY